MRVTLLGCGGSEGVPLVGGIDGRGDWGACDPANPRNRRMRASIHVRHGAAGILIDTSPDLRAQLLANGISAVSHVLYTHDHADHSHGIHDLRRIARAGGRPLDAFAEPETLAGLKLRFAFAFGGAADSAYPPILAPHAIEGPFEIAGLAVTPFAQDHGIGTTLGFRIGDLGYSTDVVAMTETGFAALAGVRVWIVDAFQRKPHPTHSHLEKTLGWIERLKPGRAILTHMSSDLDYEAVRKTCPPGVEPGYDGLSFDL